MEPEASFFNGCALVRTKANCHEKRYKFNLEIKFDHIHDLKFNVGCKVKRTLDIKVMHISSVDFWTIVRVVSIEKTSKVIQTTFNFQWRLRCFIINSVIK